MCVKLKLARPLVLCLGCSDRDGAFTTTYGATQSLFDVVAGKVLLDSSRDSMVQRIHRGPR